MVIFFNSVLLRGNRAIKVDSQGLAAFDSPNLPPLATVGATVVPYGARKSQIYEASKSDLRS